MFQMLTEHQENIMLLRHELGQLIATFIEEQGRWADDRWVHGRASVSILIVREMMRRREGFDCLVDDFPHGNDFFPDGGAV